MAGHGSPPDPDRATHPNRQVGRDSGLYRESYMAQVGSEPVLHTVEEFRPPAGSPESRRRLTPAGTRFRWAMSPGGAGNETFGGRVATTATLKRAQVAVARSGERYAQKRDRFTGR
jgi:hypothetical protein